jgi:hypothetical protein
MVRGLPISACWMSASAFLESAARAVEHRLDLDEAR